MGAFPHENKLQSPLAATCAELRMQHYSYLQGHGCGEHKLPTPLW